MECLQETLEVPQLDIICSKQYFCVTLAVPLLLFDSVKMYNESMAKNIIL